MKMRSEEENPILIVIDTKLWGRQFRHITTQRLELLLMTSNSRAATESL